MLFPVPALPCPASSSLQHLPPTAGRTLDSPSEIPPRRPGPHLEEPRLEEEVQQVGSVIWALNPEDGPALH